MKKVVFALCILFMMTSCVSMKKHKELAKKVELLADVDAAFVNFYEEQNAFNALVNGQLAKPVKDTLEYYKRVPTLYALFPKTIKAQKAKKKQ